MSNRVCETGPTTPEPAHEPAWSSQEELSTEIAQLHLDHRDDPRGANDPLLDFAPYRSSLLRHPTKDLQPADPEEIELWAPCFGHRDVAPEEADLTLTTGGDPLGERMIVTGRVVDGDGRPVADQLVEVWQANAAGRYRHQRDQHAAPIDPNFVGVGRCLTGPDGSYRFVTIKPGPYPWRNHHNAWRPAHIHFSLFGTDFTQRLVTQMYFPADPLLELDPIFQSILNPRARDMLVASFDHSVAEHEWATGYRWDVVLSGSRRTPLEQTS